MVVDNADIYQRSQTVNELILDRGFIINNGCSRIGQIISAEYGLLYAEGLILHPLHRDSPLNEVYTSHSFNICNNTVEDYFLTPKFPKDCLPSEYCGMIIPKDYILEKNPDQGNIPLILNYWRDHFKN